MTHKQHEDEDDIVNDVAVDIAKEGKEQASLEHPSYEQLEAKLTAAETEVSAYKEQVLRIQAEMENLRRRQEREIASAHKFSLESVFRALLDVADNLERSLDQKHDAATEGIRTGVELTLKQLQSVFNKFAVKALHPLEEAFDPTLHEAMSMQESTDQAAGTVLAVLQKGYLLHDRLLRPAMVVVAKAPAGSASS